MMTKQHFESIAAVLKSLKPHLQEHWGSSQLESSILEQYGAAQRQWKATVRAFAADGARQNARFQASRFYAACGMEAD